jgi:3-phenylpropionate/trans-cinnamate dioxygenase ferredoxin subunit
MAAHLVRVAKADEIPPGQVRVFRTGDLRLAICRVQDEFYAIEDVCTHDDGPLGEGSLVEVAIECPRHGARFDVRTGDVLRMPAAAPVQTFPVQVKDGEIYVQVETD